MKVAGIGFFILVLALGSCANDKADGSLTDQFSGIDMNLSGNSDSTTYEPYYNPPRTGPRKFEQVIFIADTNGLSYLPKRILKVSGDFDGDGHDEILNEYYFDATTNKRMRQVPMDGDMEWLYMHKATTWLVSDSECIPPLKVDEESWGLLSLLNLNDINNDGIDEIAIVRDNADFSNLTSCWIYQYCKGNWKVLYTFGVNEVAYWYGDEFDESVYYREIPGFLENRKGRWYYYDNYDPENEKFHDENWDIKLVPLAPDIPSGSG